MPKFFLMRPIQFLLVPLLLFLLVLFWIRLKQQPVMRPLVAVVMGLALVFTVFPDSSTLLANQLGVGRGVDMVIYLSLIGLSSGLLLLYLRLQQLERKLAEVSRQLALQQARPPAPAPGDSPHK
jgi:small membrane protein